MKLADKPYQAKQLDDNKHERNVWIFPVIQIENSPLQIKLKSEANSIDDLLANEPKIVGEDKLALVKQRIGHGTFKDLLVKKYRKCCICGITQKDFLIGSHIKPWSKSSAEEKVDVNNGLLLCPHHDALFDKGFISFNDNGNILISDKLDQNSSILMNINDNIQLVLDEETVKYIRWHRHNHYNGYGY